MSQRQVLQVFEQYQRARTQFVQTVAELATRPQNIETLQNADTAVGRGKCGAGMKQKHKFDKFPSPVLIKAALVLQLLI
ncbi:UNVERIFIED_CONTAM: hypothetical protein K2H54_027142 [Gekko kuhli]